MAYSSITNFLLARKRLISGRLLGSGEAASARWSAPPAIRLSNVPPKASKSARAARQSASSLMQKARQNPAFHRSLFLPITRIRLSLFVFSLAFVACGDKKAANTPPVAKNILVTNVQSMDVMCSRVLGPRGESDRTWMERTVGDFFKKITSTYGRSLYFVS
jgi:hypothetical protein